MEVEAYCLWVIELYLEHLSGFTMQQAPQNDLLPFV